MFTKSLLAVGVVLSLVAIQGCDKKAEEKATETKLDTLEQRISYAIGSDIAQNLKKADVQVDPEIVVQAFKEVYGGAESRMSQEEMVQANREMVEQLQQREQQKQAELGDKSKAEGEAFLVENGKKEGVVTTASGLQYKIITEGKGPKPTAQDTVTVHYRGTLLDGTEFDSSYARDMPATFPLQNVISGWTEGLQLMGEGAKFEFYIPSNLAYGPGGNHGIPPNATLKFEVELLKAKAE
jgi:FKBP-type peptidyl-prolyl cis-trans isomerase